MPDEAKWVLLLFEIKAEAITCHKIESHKLFHLLLLLNVISPLTCKIWKLGFISNNLTSTRPKSGGSL